MQLEPLHVIQRPANAHTFCRVILSSKISHLGVPRPLQGATSSVPWPAQLHCCPEPGLLRLLSARPLGCAKLLQSAFYFVDDIFAVVSRCELHGAGTTFCLISGLCCSGFWLQGHQLYWYAPESLMMSHLAVCICPLL